MQIAIELPYLWRERRIPAGLSTGRHRGQSPPMKTIGKRDDFKRSALMELPPLTG